MSKELGWPAAATMIAAMIGAAASAAVMAITPVAENKPQAFASAREIGEVKARLEAIEKSNEQLRTELRSDIREVRELVQRLLKEK